MEALNVLVAMPEGEIRNAFLPPATVSKLEAFATIHWNRGAEQLTEERFMEDLRGMDVCITGWGCRRIDRTILQNARDLKILVHTGGTVAPYVSEELFERGIRVLSGNELYAESVAEGVLGYMLCSLRRIDHYNREVHEGRWRADVGSSEGLLDQCVGLTGFGTVCRHLVRLLKPFRCPIRVYSRHMSDGECRAYGVERASLDEVFSRSRIISLHNALTAETHHLVGRRLLELIPDGALLINTARGAIVDERALEEELCKGRFRAVLDVFEKEPLRAGSALRGLENVILMPHMAGPTPDRWSIITEELLQDARRCLAGEAPRYEITRDQARTMTR